MNGLERLKVSRRCIKTERTLSYISKLGRCVARNTSTAELLASPHAFDKITYPNHVSKDFEKYHKTEVILDPMKSFHLHYTVRNHKEIKTK